MAVKVRLSRCGRTHAPVFRIVATNSRNPRDGKALEILGTYNPLKHEIVQLHEDRIAYWASQGAQVSDAVEKIRRMHRQAKAA